MEKQSNAIADSSTGDEMNLTRGKYIHMFKPQHCTGLLYLVILLKLLWIKRKCSLPMEVGSPWSATVQWPSTTSKMFVSVLRHHSMKCFVKNYIFIT